jgi:predicted GH43/DUF377 family glycosyl hydrolase
VKLTKFEGNPILSPHPDHCWENFSVCNPGAWVEDGTFYLLYRAAGDDEDHVIHFGLATSKDGFHFERYGERPVVSPSEDGPDAGCIEDPRIVKFGEDYYITYAYRPFPPGRYWLNPGNDADKPYADSEPSRFLRDNLTNSGVMITRDFLSYKRLGRITSPVLDDRDVILFPEKIGGQYVMLHRPKEWVGEQYGTNYPAIWISFSDDVMNWKDSRLLIKGEYEWERKIGGSTPPLRTKWGWLTLYHGVDDHGLYRTGAVMLDLEDPMKILGRTREAIMEPEFEYEMKGIYNGVAFPTGNVIVGDTLYVYYGGADQYCCVATANVEELVEYILNHA